jgi:membrane protease YdiL (CAAX protease family)
MTPDNPDGIAGQHINAETSAVPIAPSTVAPPPLPTETLPTPPPARPYGFWSSLGISVIIFIVSQIGAGIVLGVLWTLGVGASLKNSSALSTSGYVITVSCLTGTPILCGLTFLFIALRRRIGPIAYLGLRWPNGKTILRWTLAMLLMLAIFDSISLMVRSTVVVDFMIQAYKTALNLPLFLLAVMFVGPLGEEFLFRGFLLEGFRHSRLGNRGAIIATALLWAALHYQYDLFGMTEIVIAGILLGYARVKTGSLWLCIGLHSLMNIIATVELLLHLHFVRNNT